MIILCLLLSACGQEADYAEVRDEAEDFPLVAEPAPDNPQQAVSNGPYAVLHTTAGEVTILLYPEQAPKAVENFIGLAEAGYYDGSSFYYIKRDELVQGGRPAEYDRYVEVDMEDGDGEVPDGALERSIWGNEFEDEFDDGLHNFPGAVGMAGAATGANQNLSQFYFQLSDKKAEDERVIPANFYMNELIRLRTKELNEKNQESRMSEEEIMAFEADLNEELQRIAIDGVPKEYMKRYRPVLDQYQKTGGAWSLDYKHTVFGQIIRGLNVAKAMTRVKVDASTRRPVRDILIERIEIVETLPE